MKANFQEGVCRKLFNIPHDFKSRDARHKSRRNKNVVVASGFTQHRFTGGLKISPPPSLGYGSEVSEKMLVYYVLQMREKFYSAIDISAYYDIGVINGLELSQDT